MVQTDHDVHLGSNLFSLHCTMKQHFNFNFCVLQKVMPSYLDSLTSCWSTSCSDRNSCYSPTWTPWPPDGAPAALTGAAATPLPGLLDHLLEHQLLWPEQLLLSYLVSLTTFWSTSCSDRCSCYSPTWTPWPPAGGPAALTGAALMSLLAWHYFPQRSSPHSVLYKKVTCDGEPRICLIQY